MQGQPSPAKRSSFSAFAGGNTSLLLEKAKAGIRRSTPDSEALASSDDELDQHHQVHSSTYSLGAKPTRRLSWLSEVQSAPQRKGSLSGSATFSPVSSHPTTPAGDQATWGSSMAVSSGSMAGRGHSNSASFPWSSGIWNNDSQKIPPARLTEVLPSPRSLGPSGSASYYIDDPLTSPSLSRDNPIESAIPFPIPLHPTPKTYRSQSYSVGQMDSDSSQVHPNATGSHFPTGRNRNGASYTGVQSRPSRSSIRGELSHDASILGQVREVDDDDESSTGSEEGAQLVKTQARTIEQLAMENVLLRQEAARQLEQSNVPTHADNAQTVSNVLAPQSSTQASYPQRMYENGVDGTEYALDELEDPNTNPAHYYQGSGRRLSEYSANLGEQYPMTGIPENRKLESVKKGHWQSSLGFGGIGEPSQSRRHSFANVATRHGSMSSIGGAESLGIFAGPDHGMGLDVRHGSPGGFGDGLARPSQGENGEYDQFRSRQSSEEEALELEHLRARNFAASYFSGVNPSTRGGEAYAPSVSPSSLHHAYGMQSQYGRSQPQPRPNQLLYIVTFKCCRGEVFYVQEGTGLQVKPGDLVIVEADRGTDLGTVAHDNIPWGKAKELKEHYAEEHYRWLMMFSRQCQNGPIATQNPNGLSVASNGAQISAVGGMGPPGQQGMQEPPNAELKPKMIKRLAQSHEIQTLREKEGTEAKAKRTCQQKVLEHRLNMEILDAEFQMDWKKLTFYYFADSYINFNSLVTDLFKIYKTRIWMSAINPASFVTPTAGLQLPSGSGPGALGLDRDNPHDRRRQKENFGFSNFGSSQVLSGGFEQLWDPTRNAGDIHGTGYTQAYPPSFQGHTINGRQLSQHPPEYGQAMPQSFASHAPYSVVSPNALDRHHADYNTSSGGIGGGRKPQVSGSDWGHAFQGLSLGS